MSITQVTTGYEHIKNSPNACILHTQETNDNPNAELILEQIRLGIAALETIESCPKCKSELIKKVKSDRKSDSTTEDESAELNGKYLSTT